MERARVTEAKHILGVIRSAQAQYYAQYYQYTTSLSDLGLEDLAGPDASKFFNYTGFYDDYWVGRAVRKVVSLPPGFVVYRVTIAEDGYMFIQPNTTQYNKLL